MIAQFVCTSTQALDPAVLKITGTSPLTLLLYLQTRVDYGSGERTLAYDHAQAAGALGIDERTIRRYFRRLVEAGLVVARRLAHGVTFGIARQPAAPPERTDVSVHFHVRTPPERTDVSADERTDVSVQPSRGENPDSESTNQRVIVGGGGTVVGGPTALAPPLEDGAALSGSAKVAEVERLLQAAQPPVAYILLPDDMTAIAEQKCRYTAAQIAGCYIAIYRGQTGDGWLKDNLTVKRAIGHVAPWSSQLAGYRAPPKRPPSGGQAVRHVAAAAGITAEELAAQQRSAEAFLRQQDEGAQRRYQHALPG